MKETILTYLSSSAWLMTYRVIAAIFGGFGLTLTSSMLLAQLLALFFTDRANASISAMLFSFALYTAIVMWFFSINSVKKVWFNLIMGLLATGSLVLFIKYWSSL